MATLADSVANWLGRVELLARGVDEERREALRALDRGDPLAAREHALALLDKVPNSPVGLAILVDACEALWLDDEAAGALRKLCDSAPWRGELWVRLAAVLSRLGEPPEDLARVLENALEPDMDPSARRSALLSLADLDLAAGDAWRASRWLDALRLHADQPDVALRRLELGLMIGDRIMVSSAVESLGEPETLDGRATLAIGRSRWLLAEPTALDLLLRAFVLDAPGSSEALAAYLAKSRDVIEVKRVRDVLELAGEASNPSFALALALAEGRNEDARRALADIARAGDVTAARSLYDIALERKDWTALRTSVGILGVRAPSEAAKLLAAWTAFEDARLGDALEQLDTIPAVDTPAGAMAHALRTRVMERWLDDDSEESFRRILSELRRAAGRYERLDLVGASEALAVEQRRPLRVAVVGEFNAGKSTFINALLGADVAPTGILPTTASLHWLSWAPDLFARIVTAEGADRIVPHEGLKAALDELRLERRVVREVHICAPIERLRRIEVLDTPGFNAPDADHINAATRAVHEAHVALWILDGTQALKDSERRVLARIADVGTPVQVLVNKCDRLEPKKADEVVDHVSDGLALIGLPSMSAVVGFSARLALRGRLGDTGAASRSGWDAVERLLAGSIVDRSDELRAMALRRKALVIARSLDELARVSQAPGRGESFEAQALPAQGARLLALDRTGCERVAQRVQEARSRVDDDLRPLRVAGLPVDDVNASAYAEARVLARIVGPLSEALVDVADVDRALEPTIRLAVGPVLRGATAEAGDLERMASIPAWRTVRACAMAAHERIMALHDELREEVVAEPVVLRISALCEVLARRLGRG